MDTLFDLGCRVIILSFSTQPPVRGEARAEVVDQNRDAVCINKDVVVSNRRASGGYLIADSSARTFPRQ
jgi:hypothetical protein